MNPNIFAKQTGLSNLGQTCFMSAPLQVFYSIATFRERLLRPDWEQDFQKWDQVGQTEGYTSEEVARSLQVVRFVRDLFLNMKQAKRRALIPPKQLMHALNFEVGDEVRRLRNRQRPSSFSLERYTVHRPGKNPPTYEQTFPAATVGPDDPSAFVDNFLQNFRVAGTEEFKQFLSGIFEVNRDRYQLHLDPRVDFNGTFGDYLLKNVKNRRGDFTLTPAVLLLSNQFSMPGQTNIDRNPQIQFSNHIRYNEKVYTLHALIEFLPNIKHYIAFIVNHQNRSWFKYDDSSISRENVEKDHVFDMKNIRLAVYIRNDQINQTAP